VDIRITFVLKYICCYTVKEPDAHKQMTFTNNGFDRIVNNIRQYNVFRDYVYNKRNYETY